MDLPYHPGFNNSLDGGDYLHSSSSLVATLLLRGYPTVIFDKFKIFIGIFCC